MMLRHLAFFTALIAAPLQAQLPARIVSGVVFDSLAHAPLAGAVVQVALVDMSAGAASTTRVFSG
ncbi:MAG: hypothetical protein ABIY52_13370, partial [Gemmatimonadaceae bacterium]